MYYYYSPSVIYCPRVLRDKRLLVKKDVIVVVVVVVGGRRVPSWHESE